MEIVYSVKAKEMEFKQEITVCRLKHGMRLAIAQMPGTYSVAVGFFAGVGSRDESPDQNGICHFIEHMLFKGTRKRTCRQISEAIEGVGGYLNAYTCEEHTCYYARAPKKYLFRVLDVLADMYLRSIFRVEEVEKERRVILDEISMVQDQPQQWIQELMSEALWPDHPLGRPLTGTVTTVQQICYEDLIAFYQTRYVGENSIIVIAGDVEAAECWEWAQKIDRQMRRGKAISLIPASTIRSVPCWRIKHRKVEQAQLAFGFRVSSRRDPDRHAVRILNVLLGENMSSRLFVRLREEEGLAYSVNSSVNYYEDAGELVITVSVDPAQVEKVSRLIAEELIRLRLERIPRREFERAREYVLGQMDLSLEGTENRMLWLGEQLARGGPFFTLQELKTQIQSVGPQDVWNAARKYLQRGRLAIAVIGPGYYRSALRRAFEEF